MSDSPNIDYQTYKPSQFLDGLISCYWTLKVPAAEEPQRQRIVPDGCIEMAFLLGDDVKRYTSEDDFTLQPRAMVIGQTPAPFYIEPTGYVDTFAVRFYPYGFANFVTTPIEDLVNKETPIESLFGKKEGGELQQEIVRAAGTNQRIEAIENFLLGKYREERTVDSVVKMTIDSLLLSKGNAKIGAILEGSLSKRRQLERKFRKQIGLSAKELGKVIRLQSALKLLLDDKAESLTAIAYESDYYDQSHFIRDFKSLTGLTPKEFLGDESMALSTLFYR